jgi:hypothetical protein
VTRGIARPLAAVVAAVALLAAGCGDDTGDGGNEDGAGTDGPGADADIDAPPEANFTSFVIDLVTNQTAGNTPPRAFADFSDLGDPDLNNPDAYDGLFP